jgi:hypothetical protein
MIRKGVNSSVSNWVDRFFRTDAPAPLDEISERLWTGDASSQWRARDANYYNAVMDQYKLYVEMADRVSARRGLASTFFLTLNTAGAVAMADLWQTLSRGSAVLVVAPLVALLGQCLAWFWTLRSYRQLNGAKYAVVANIQ